MNNLKLLIGRGEDFYDITDLVTRFTWSGKRSKAPRTLEAALYDSESLTTRCPSNVEEGQTVVFYDGDEELFQGLLMNEGVRSTKRQLTLKANDVCIRFTNNKDSFSYTNVRADEIFRDCCQRLGLEVGSVANTKHVIGELIKKATTNWDVIEDALSQTYKVTGVRYYVFAYKGKVNLIDRAAQEDIPILELDTNIVSYGASRSIENTRTRLKLVTSEGELKNSTVISELEEKIGQFQEYESVDEQITETEILQRVKTFRREQGTVELSMNLQCVGDSSVISGGCVFVNIDNLNTHRILYVDEDRHVWKNGSHTMSLKLNCAKIDEDEKAVRNLKLGDYGDDVFVLQLKLQNHGYYIEGELDGWFGPITDRSVRKFQKASGIAVDGIVGPVTRAALGM